ncbi:MAG: hypothetical protein HYW07_04935 [Candidatus Latescibacteria bacterium]|nr:hypothetical protein [Candidatus Latescibacterota bacterium]
MDEDKHRQNEKKFGQWQSLTEGGRRYLYEVSGRRGWKARYIKEVNAQEETVSFYQEIYNAEGKLVEVHRKFPMDTGHQRTEQEP